MSDARALFSEAEGRDEPAAPSVGGAALRELALMRLLLEAIRTDVEAIRQEVEAFSQASPAKAPPPHPPASWEDPLPPGAGAPLAAGGGASSPGFPASFRTRTGGGR